MKKMDCIFVEMDAAFETITGQATIKVLPGIKGSGVDWIDAFRADCQYRKTHPR